MMKKDIPPSVKLGFPKAVSPISTGLKRAFASRSFTTVMAKSLDHGTSIRMYKNVFHGNNDSVSIHLPRVLLKVGRLVTAPIIRRTVPMLVVVRDTAKKQL